MAFPSLTNCPFLDTTIKTSYTGILFYTFVACTVWNAITDCKVRLIAVNRCGKVLANFFNYIDAFAVVYLRVIYRFIVQSNVLSRYTIVHEYIRWNEISLIR